MAANFKNARGFWTRALNICAKGWGYPPTPEFGRQGGATPAVHRAGLGRPGKGARPKREWRRCPREVELRRSGRHEQIALPGAQATDRAVAAVKLGAG